MMTEAVGASDAEVDIVSSSDGLTLLSLSLTRCSIYSENVSMCEVSVSHTHTVHYGLRVEIEGI